MIRATLRIRVRPGLETEFEQVWRQVSEVVTHIPGNIRQALLREPRDKQSYVITSDWETSAAFRSFERSPEQEALTARLRELRESAQMSVHDVVVHVDATDPAPGAARAVTGEGQS